MIVSNFLINGYFENIKIGKKIKLLKCIIKNQEGDIPGIIELDYVDFFFQVYFFNKIIIGISIDFEYFPKNKFIIRNNFSSFNLSYNSKLNKIKQELIKLHIEFEIQDVDNYNSLLIIKKSNVRLFFFKDCLHKASIFDQNLYDLLSNN